ncbi:MAG: mercury(II) reductase [Dehalococcoidales bacterium]|nr:mercury(II) reductase [Dehalococcoidales bacterium]
MRVEGMTCPSCEIHVARALERAGAIEPRADFRRGEVRLRVPATVELDALALAVRGAGYEPGAVEVLPPESARGPRASSGDGAYYDLAIIGSGGAAFAAAIRAREAGASVVMIERGVVGGTCVNVGCVPSKTQLRAAELFHQAAHQPFTGARTAAGGVELARLVDQKDQLVGRLRKEKYEDLIGEYGWELIKGEAAFLDEGHLEVAGRTVSARSFLIATGASPAVPPIPGLQEAGYLTSTTALDLRELPKSLAVIGSGYVALEMGQLFHHLGSRVTLMQRSPRILKDYEPEVSEAVFEAMTGQGMSFLIGVAYEQVERTDAGYRVMVKAGGERRVVEAEQLLVAVGRQPNTGALHLDRAGVTLGERAEVLVDRQLRTSNPRIYAAGDVTLGPQFVYVAAYEGSLAAENALGGSRSVDLSTVPTVIFTTPSVATVGLTEAQARASGLDVKTSVLPATAVPRALANRATEGVFKLVADETTGRIVGAHVVAENAGEVIYAATLAVKFRLTVSDLTSTFAPYLTMAEGLKLAAQTFGRDVSKLSCCAA